MRSRQKRFGALLLATLYFCFAGGIEFLHNHSDGVFPDVNGIGRAISGPRFTHTGWDKAIASRTAPATECAACQWDRYAHATTPTIVTPVIAPSIEVAFVTSTPEIPETRSPLVSSRGPPLA